MLHAARLESEAHHLVEYQQRIMFEGEDPERIEKRPIRRQHAGRTHHRLDDHRRDLLAAFA